MTFFNSEGYIPGELVPQRKAKKCMVSKIVIHKPKKESVKYVFPWEEYTRQANQSYINNVILGKDK